uniref:Uncharacterized protein n=1 Tax=Cannabis sativa TaxID=3483 RepID=A0A803QRA5_CANSA
MDPLHWHKIAAISGVAAVGLGAYGAHAFKPQNAAYKEVWHTASLYHLVHTAALLAAPITKRPHVFGGLLSAGLVAFSGTCYAVALLEDRKYSTLAPFGQSINVRKFTLGFSSNTDMASKIEINSYLGFCELDMSNKFLSNPLLMSNSQVRDFEFIKDCNLRRLDGWKCKFLSQVGRKTPINSVICATPIYAMSTFLLLKGLCESLDKLVCNGMLVDIWHAPWISWLDWEHYQDAFNPRVQCRGITLHSTLLNHVGLWSFEALKAWFILSLVGSMMPLERWIVNPKRSSVTALREPFGREVVEAMVVKLIGDSALGRGQSL